MADSDDVRVVASGPGGGRRRAGPVLVLLGVVAALLVGLLVGRLTAPDDDGAQPSSPAGRDAAVGPTRSLSGVPVGYARSEDGAAAALLNYSVVLSRLLLEEPPRREAALNVMGTTAFAAETARRLKRARAAADQGSLGEGLEQGATTVYRGGPLGFRIVRFSRDAATIDTWAFGLVANTAGLGPQMTFQSATSTLAWQDGDWKLASTRSRPGPTPQVDGEPADPRTFVDAIARLRDLRYAP